MIYKQWPALRRSPWRSNYLLGVLILIASIFVLYVSQLSGILVIENIALLITLIGVILILLGYKRLKVIILPLLFLIVPLGLFDYLLNAVSIYLQVITATIANLMLNGLGILTIQDGPYLLMPHIFLVVDPSCNGINHITALVVLALVLGSAKSKNVLFFLILLSFILGLLLNGVRVTLIGLWAVFFEGDLLHGPGSIFYVSFIFITGSLFLIFLATKFEDKSIPKNEKTGHEESPPKNLLWAVLLTIGILASGGILIHYAQPKAQPLAQSLEKLPSQLGPFQGEDYPLSNPDYMIADSDAWLNRLYTNPAGDSLLVYVAYLAEQSQDREVVNYRNRALLNRARVVDISDGIQLNRLNYRHGQQEGLLYLGYWIDGEVHHSPTRAKLATLWTGLFQRRTSGALLVVWSLSSASEEKNSIESDQQFLAALLPEVQKMLN